MSYTLTIKLEPYLQEYLQCKLNDPVNASNNILGAIIKPFLETMPKTADVNRFSGPEYFTFEIPHVSWINNRNGTVWISPENKKCVQRILKAHFKDILYAYVEDKRRYRISDAKGNNRLRLKIKDIILQFCDDNHMRFSSINYETLKKIYYRQQIENTIIFSNKLSLNCPLMFLV